MFCPKCGRQFEANEKFCAGCGTPVEAPAAPEAEVAYEEPVVEAVDNVETVNEVVAEETPVEAAVSPFDAPVAVAPVKKNKKGLIIGIVAAVTAVAVILGVILGPKLFGGPNQKLKKVGKGFAEDISVVAGSLDGVSAFKDGIAYSGSAKITIGDDIIDLLNDNVGVKLDALAEINMEYDVKMSSKALGMNATIGLSKKEIFTYNIAMDLEKQYMYMQVPELSDEVLRMNLGEISSLGGSSYYDDSYDYDLEEYAESGIFATEEMEMVEDIMAALPSEDEIEDIIYDYICIAIDAMGDIESTKGKLTAQGVSQSATKLTVPISEQLVMDVVLAVAEEAADDKRITNIVADVVDAAGGNGKSVVSEFKSGVKSFVEMAKEQQVSKEAMFDVEIWLDKKENVIGLAVEIDEADVDVKYASVVSGGKYGFELIADVSGEGISVVGSGKQKNDKRTAEYTVSVNGDEYIILSLENFDLEKLEDGQMVGKIGVKLGEALVDMISDELPSEIPESIVKKAELVLDINSNDKGGKFKLDFMVGGASMASFEFEMELGKNSKVTIPDYDVTDIEEWAQGFDVDTLMEALEKAGIPVEDIMGAVYNDVDIYDISEY